MVRIGDAIVSGNSFPAQTIAQCDAEQILARFDSVEYIPICVDRVPRQWLHSPATARSSVTARSHTCPSTAWYRQHCAYRKRVRIDDAISRRQLLIGQAATKIRFNFISDGAWSDQDGLYNTDGACIVDSLVIADASGTIDYEDFESASVGDSRADGDGNDFWWRAEPAPGYGLHSGLVSSLQDKDPCGQNFGTQIVFFIGSPHPSASYPGLFDTPFCKGPQTQASSFRYP